MIDIHRLSESMTADLLAALEAAAPHFNALPVTPRGHRSYSGMSLDLFVQHGYVQVSLRSGDERILGGDIGDWAEQGFLSSLSGPCDEELGRIVETIKRFEESSELETQDLQHVLSLAAAEAILDPRVAELLNGYKIGAKYFGSTLGGYPFEFYVMEPDAVLKANYCDIVRANRVTARILLKSGG